LETLERFPLFIYIPFFDPRPLGIRKIKLKMQVEGEYYPLQVIDGVGGIYDE
jgi:hypothetical protein